MRNAIPQLSASWWRKEQPANLVKSPKAFGAALQDYENAREKLGSSPDEEKVTAVLQALTKVESTASAVSSEASQLLRKATDKDVKKDLQNTIDAVGRNLGKLIAAVRDEVDQDEEDGIFASATAHGDYLKEILKRVRKRPHSFAFGLVSNERDAQRFLFHKTKAPETLAKRVRKEANTRKVVWGIAGAEAEGDEAIAAKTLTLSLDSKPLPGLAKRAKYLLRELEIETFKSVKILVEGNVVESALETDEESEEELPPIPTEDESGAKALLHDGWTRIKQKLAPLIRKAVEANPAYKTQLASLVEKAINAAGDDDYATAIAIFRDKIAPLLKSASRAPTVAPAEPETLSVEPAKASPTAKKDLLNSGLGKVLDRTFPPSDETFVGRFFRGSGKAKTSGRRFFDDATVTFPKNKTQENAALMREWALNMSLLQHMAVGLSPDSPEYTALMNRSLGYLMKFANVPNAPDLNWQSNPVQLAEKDGMYHRSGGAPLYTKMREVAAESLGVPFENLYLASDARVLEEVRRDYSPEGETEDYLDWDQVDYERVIRKALAGEAVFLDLTRFMKEICDGSRTTPANAAEMAIVAFREAVLKSAAEKRGYALKSEQDLANLGKQTGDPPKSEDQLKKELADKAEIEREWEFTLKQLESSLKIGGCANLGGLCALTVFPFTKEATVGGGTNLALSGEQAKRIMEIVGHSGFTAGPQQLMDQWVQLAPVGSILKELGVKDLPKVKFADGARLETFANFDADFVGSDTVRGFEGLAAPVEAAPYLKVTTKTLMKLVKGLKAEGVEEALKAQGLEGLWAMSLNRIQGFMSRAVEHKDSMKDFLNETNLIMEEISTLLAVAKPYEAKDFGPALKKATDMLPEGFPKEVSVEFSLKNSASRCFNAVLTACEDEKERRQGLAGHLAKRGLEVMVQGDSYYEPSMYVLEHAREHQQTGLNTDQIDDAEAFEEQLKGLKEGGGKLDTYLCEFHHNISYSRKEYKPEDVKKQVKKLIEAEVVAVPFTVAIDTTIAKTDEGPIKDFLNEFKDKIKDGEMNVVIYRSAQKFDQMGADTYNGGVMCCISAKTDAEEVNPFQQALDSAGEPPADENVQGLTHLNKHAQAEINEYRSAIMENTRKLGHPDSTSACKFPDTMLLKPENVGRSLVQIAVNTDEEAPFLDIKFPFVDLPDKPPETAPKSERDAWQSKHDCYQKLYNDLFTLMQDKIADNPDQMPGSHRASFGFQHSNFTMIEPVKLRFNPGLDDEQTLAHYRDAFVTADKIMMRMKADCDAAGTMSQENLEKAYAKGVLCKEVFDVFRALETAGDDATDANHYTMAVAYAGPIGNYRNPQGVLRELALLTDERFIAEHKQDVDSMKQYAALMIEALLEPSDDERHLKAANMAVTAGLFREVERELGLLTEPFKTADANAPKVQKLSDWIEENRDAWDDEAERRVKSALKARSDGDVRRARAALEHDFSEGFRKLRGDQINQLEDWIKSALLDENCNTVAGLREKAQKQREADQPNDVLETLKAINWMRDNAPEGLPEDLGEWATEMGTWAKAAAGRRAVTQALAGAKQARLKFDDVHDLDAQGKLKDFVKRRLKGLDTIGEGTPDWISEDQQSEIEELRAWANGG